MTFYISKISVSVDFRFVALITLMLVLFPDSLAAMCFLMCVLHETGHLLAMVLFGKRAEKITFDYFGMKIDTDKHFIPPAKEALIAFSGPCVNLIMSAIFYLLGKNDVAVLNLALAVFNLLPVTMLDGGHIVSAFFPDSRLHRILSISCAVILLAVGIFVLVYTKSNFTITIVALYLLIGVISEK